MDFSLNPEDRAFLDEFRGYLDALKDEGFYAEEPLVRPDHAVAEDDLALRKEFIRRLGRDGWLGVSWPKEYGGGGHPSLHQWLMLDELAYRNLPAMLLGVLIVGRTLMRIGSAEHKTRFLPGLLFGELEFCLGYTEPGAGTDLANLQCRAVRDGDEYVVNGQKIYTTGAQYASHVWLTVRTGDPASRSRGVSVLTVPLDTPGITVRPLITGADYRTNEVFYDGVRVPVSARVGEENEGWRVISMALDFERTPTSNRHVREFGELVEWATGKDENGRSPTDDPHVRGELGKLATDLEVGRLYSLRIAGMIANGEVPAAEASMSKVWLTELGQRLPEKALALMGAAGGLHVGQSSAPLNGLMELTYRESPVFKFAAGTNEVQRDIIAQRGLGLPRNRK